MNWCVQGQTHLHSKTVASCSSPHTWYPLLLKNPGPCRNALGVQEPPEASCPHAGEEPGKLEEPQMHTNKNPKASCSTSQMSTAKHTTHTKTEHTGWGNYRIISKIFAPLTLLSAEPLSKVEELWLLFRQSAAFRAQEQFAKPASFRYLRDEAIKKELNCHFYLEHKRGVQLWNNSELLLAKYSFQLSAAKNKRARRIFGFCPPFFLVVSF